MDDYQSLAGTGADRVIIGDKISAMKRARTGGILIEINGDHGDTVKAVWREVERTTGDEGKIRTLQQRCPIEIRFTRYSSKSKLQFFILNRRLYYEIVIKESVIVIKAIEIITTRAGDISSITIVTNYGTYFKTDCYL